MGERKREDLPNAEEALLGVGFTSGGELDSLPDKTSRVVLLHYLHHSRPPERSRTHLSLSLSLSLSTGFLAVFITLHKSGAFSLLVQDETTPFAYKTFIFFYFFLRIGVHFNPCSLAGIPKKLYLNFF